MEELNIFLSGFAILKFQEQLLQGIMDQEKKNTAPPCANYSIWTGPEIEGTAGIGERTLFIRSLRSFPSIKPDDDLSWLREKSKCTRVWFCKEFTDWPLLKAISRHFSEVCVEVEPKCYESVPLAIRKKCRIYLKVDLLLKDGDFVCVGPAFSDESFEIGKGARVKPEQYLGDKKIA